jgi:hypothetical protein
LQAVQNIQFVRDAKPSASLRAFCLLRVALFDTGFKRISKQSPSVDLPFFAPVKRTAAETKGPQPKLEAFEFLRRRRVCLDG